MTSRELPRDWNVSDAEQRLLEFVAALILDLARTHSHVTQEQVAVWLARVALGVKK